MGILTIKPYTEYTLDCIQNLYVSLLHHYQYDIRLLGACWPWEFKLIDARRPSDILQKQVINTRLTSEERLIKIYGAKLMYHAFADIGSMWREIKAMLENNVPVVVGIDHFDVQYRAQIDKYHVQQGEHTVMLQGYNSSSRELYFIDTMPVYKGSISESVFLRSLESNERGLWFSEIQFQDNRCQIDLEILWDYFIESIRRIEEGDGSSGCIYTDYFIRLMRTLLESKNEIDLEKELKCLCSGLWGWEIDRKGIWFNQFLKLCQSKNLVETVQECIDLTVKNNRNWILVFRPLFMATKGSSPEPMAEKALLKLQEIRQTDQELFELIRQFGSR